MKKLLKVEYKSQWDVDAKKAKNDCGACSLAMVLNYFGKSVTTDEVYVATGEKVDDGINFTQLTTAAKTLGFTLQGAVKKTIADIKASIDAGIPVIVVLHYGLLPQRQDTYTGGHILVVRGYDETNIYTNDPDFYSPRLTEGNGKAYPITDFTKAWNSTLDGNSPGNFWTVVPPKGWKKPSDEAAEPVLVPAIAPDGESYKDKYEYWKKEATDVRKKLKICENSKTTVTTPVESIVPVETEFKEKEVAYLDLGLQQNEEIKRLLAQNFTIEESSKFLLNAVIKFVSDNKEKIVTKVTDQIKVWKSKLVK